MNILFARLQMEHAITFTIGEPCVKIKSHIFNFLYSEFQNSAILNCGLLEEHKAQMFKFTKENRKHLSRQMNNNTQRNMLSLGLPEHVHGMHAFK